MASRVLDVLLVANNKVAIQHTAVTRASPEASPEAKLALCGRSPAHSKFSAAPAAVA